MLNNISMDVYMCVCVCLKPPSSSKHVTQRQKIHKFIKEGFSWAGIDKYTSGIGLIIMLIEKEREN